MAAVLLVFQYGQPRIFFAMGRDGLLPAWAARLDPKTRVPSTTTMVTGGLVAIAAAIGDAAETDDLTNIGTLFAFAIVSIGVVVLRVAEPDRPRPFRVPLVCAVGPLGAAACGFIMVGLPVPAWERCTRALAAGDVLRVGDFTLVFEPQDAILFAPDQPLPTCARCCTRRPMRSSAPGPSRPYRSRAARTRCRSAR